VINTTFLKICILSNFVTKLILQTAENLPENTNKKAFYSTAIQMNSSKILKRRIVSKKFDFSKFECLFWGGDEIRSLSMVFCDEIIPPQTVTFLWKIKINFSFLGTIQLFQALFRIV
jgi:hypothetical protein